MSRCVDCGNGRLSQSGPVEAARVVTSAWPVIAGRFMVPISPGVALCPTWGAAAECGVSHSQPSDGMETCSLRVVRATTTTEEKTTRLLSSSRVVFVRRPITAQQRPVHQE